MVKIFDCVKRGGHHTRPINRNCKRMHNNQSMDTNTQILNALKNLSGCMSQMENRREALSATSSSPTRTPSGSQTSHRSPVSTQGSRTPTSKDSAGTMEDNLVLSTLASLQQSRNIQVQVDTKIRELKSVDKEKGFKS